MELRHLRYFIAVAEELNYRRAAARLHIAAPPLSVQIRNLEQELGTSLFQRKGRGIVLTEAGRVFLGDARRTLLEADRAATRARRAAAGEIGRLAIGYNAPTEFLVFPRVIPAFRQRHPDVRLDFHFGQLAGQLDGLHDSRLDIGFVWLPVPAQGLEITPLVEEPLEVALPPGHRLAKRARLTIADLIGESMVTVSRRLAPDTFVQVQDMFARVGGGMNVAYELDNSLSMTNFVAMGLGLALMPRYTRAFARPGVSYRPLDGPDNSKTLAMVTLPDPRPALAVFRDFVRVEMDRPSPPT